MHVMAWCHPGERAMGDGAGRRDIMWECPMPIHDGARGYESNASLYE